MSFQTKQAATVAVDSSIASDGNMQMAPAWPGRRSDEEIDGLGGERPRGSNSEDTEETKGAHMMPKLDRNKQNAMSKASSIARPY